MKKLLTILFLIILFSCSKTEIESINNTLVSEYINEYGKYQKELIVYDQSKENSLFFVIHSDAPGAIDDFLKRNELTLIVNFDETNIELKSGIINESKSNLNDGERISQEIFDKRVNVQLITENIQNNVKEYFLHVESKNIQLKSSFPFHANYSVSYKTEPHAKFIGVVNYGVPWDTSEHWDIYCFLEKTNSWLAGWDVLWHGRLYGYGWPYFARLDYTSYSSSPYYKLGALVYDHPQVPVRNYYVAFEKNNFRGRSCSIGVFDTRNCYVGTAPSGTTAFMYPNNTGNFYYTPIDGNQCPYVPYPNSGFDTQNCYVVSIPAGTVGFIMDNKWFVKSELITL